MDKDLDDDFSSSGFESTEPAPAKSGGPLPLVVGLLGLILGAVALFIAYSAQSRLAELQETVASGSGGVAELQASIRQLENRVAEFSSGAGTLSSDLDALRTRFRMLDTNVRESLTTAGREIATNREAISEVSRNLVQVTEGINQRLAAPARSAPAPNTITPANAGGETSAPAAGTSDRPRIYNIQDGDTFQRIAREHGISLQALLDANPDADPRRLRINQEIIIP